jgi:Mg-chelatase subunit ChlD
VKRIVMDVSKWTAFLHRDARGLPSASQMDDGLSMLGDELFSRVYAGESERLPEEEQDRVFKDWANQVHATCDQQPHFRRLCMEVRGDAFAAGLAVEKLLEELKPHAPESRQAPPSPPQLLRRAVGKASQAAATAVDGVREAQEGLHGIAWGTGTSTAAPRSPNSAQILAARLMQDHRLRRIAHLAGRFRRIAAAKRRSKVRHGADEITDVEQGADIGRLLPSELGKLLHPKQKLAFLRDLTEHQAMQYQLSGTEVLGRGPLVVALDKSGSMDGERDCWATAVALALLEIAQRERRTFCLLAFDGEVKFEAVVKPGEPLPHEALFVGCSGGTSIANVVQRGLDIIATHPGRLRKADIVLITDGGSDAEPAPPLRERAKELGVTTLGCGIAVDPDVLTPWCDEIQTISDLNGVSDPAAEVLFTR